MHQESRDEYASSCVLEAGHGVETLNVNNS